MKLYKKVSDEYFEPVTVLFLALVIWRIVIKYTWVPLDQIIKEVEKLLGDDELTSGDNPV